MWAKQMLAQVKSTLSPPNAYSQLNTVVLDELRLMYPKHPKRRTRSREKSGRPCLSTYAKNLGAWP